MSGPTRSGAQRVARPARLIALAVAQTMTEGAIVALDGRPVEAHVNLEPVIDDLVGALAIACVVAAQCAEFPEEAFQGTRPTVEQLAISIGVSRVQRALTGIPEAALLGARKIFDDAVAEAEQRRADAKKAVG